MAWEPDDPAAVYSQIAKKIYLSVKVNELPGLKGAWGIDQEVWQALIALTEAKMQEHQVPLPPAGQRMKGMCIYASVLAKRYMVGRLGWVRTYVVKMLGGGSDHYFAVVWGKKEGVVDLTCSQFLGGPDFVAGSLSDVKASVSNVKASGLKLYDAYKTAVKAKDTILDKMMYLI